MAATVSKKTIRQWLKNYDVIVHGGRPDDDIPRNSGCKPMDGITNRLLTKIMLQEAIGKLPADLYRVVYFRWIDKLPLGFVLMQLGYSKDQYYYRCDKAVACLYDIINRV